MLRERMFALSDSGWAQKVSLILLGAILLLFLVQTYGKAYREQGYDFTSYLIAAERLLHGQDPYVTHRGFYYTYPMFLAFAAIPLSLIPYWLSNALWFAANVASLFASVYILVEAASEELGTAWGEHLYVPLAALFILMSGIVQNSLLNGQVNLVVILFSLLFLKYFLAERPVPASLFLGLAISLKLVPLIFLLFVLLRKRYRILAFSAGFIVFFALLPYLLIGNDIFGIYHRYVRYFVLSSMVRSEIPSEYSFPYTPFESHIFFTPYGFIVRLFPGSGDWPYLKIISIGSVLALVMAMESVRKGRSPGRDVWSFNLYLMAILMILPISETHHLTLIIPAVCSVTLKFLFDERWFHTKNLMLLMTFFVIFTLGRFYKESPLWFLSILLLFGVNAWILLSENGWHANCDEGSPARHPS